MEVLGAVSSVFAVTSLAVQLGSTVQRLFDFWDSVKEAPAEVAQIKSHLAVLGTLLRSIESDDFIGAENDQPETKTGIECLRLCMASFKRLETLSEALDTGLKGSGVRRCWTRMKKPMRDNEMTRYWSELERAKSMLILYQGWRNR